METDRELTPPPAELNQTFWPCPHLRRLQRFNPAGRGDSQEDLDPYEGGVQDEEGGFDAGVGG
jgi:hypothetical protein